MSAPIELLRQVPLFQKFGVLISKKDLVGPGPNPGTSTSFWNVEKWRWKR